MTTLPNPVSIGYRFANGEPWQPCEVIALEVFARGRLHRSQAAILIGRTLNQVAGACRRYGIRFVR